MSQDTQPLNTPTLAQIFSAFAGMAILGFGGVLPWARRVLVEQKGWLTGEEFIEALAVAQFLPGGNVLNLSVAVGQKFRGPAGAVVAALGLLAGPFVTVLLLGFLYIQYGQIDAVHDVLAGVAAGAAGLIISMAAKMGEPLLRQRAIVPIAFAAVIFIAIAMIELPLMLVLLMVAPLSIAYAWWKLP